MIERPDEQWVEQLLQNEVGSIRLSPAQQTRVAVRLGLDDGATTAATTSLPEISIDETDTPYRLPPTSEEIPMLTHTQHSTRRRTLEWLGGVAAIIAVALILVVIFRPPTENSGTGAGTDAVPTATVSASATADATAPATATPSMDTSLPTPDDSDAYRGLTLEQAQRLVPFTVRMPVALPDGLQGPDMMVMGPPFESDRPIYQVLSFFTLTGGDQRSAALQYTQMNASFNRPSDDEAERVQIGGKDVWKSILPRTDALPLATYTWEADGVVYHVVAQLQGPLTEEILDAFVASIPAGDVDAEPDASPTDAASMPTPDDTGMYRGLTFEQAQQLAPFTLRVPDETPEGFLEPNFMVMEPPLPDVPVHQVAVYYERAGSEQPLGIQFTLRNGSLPPTAVDQDYMEMKQIGNTSIWTWVSTREDGSVTASYLWEAAGVTHEVVAQLEGGITQEILEAFIATIPAAE